MKTVAVRLTMGLFATTLAVNVASADMLFMKTLKEKYDYDRVTCFTCHAQGINPANGKPFGKEVRNDFGKLFEPALDAKKMHDQLHKIKAAKGAAKKPLQEVATRDFLEALAGVEAMKAEDGKTYGEKLKAGEVEGVTLKAVAP